MTLTKYEQETIINFNEDESFVTIYTASPIEKRKLDKLGFEIEREPDRNKYHGKKENNYEVAWYYKVSKNDFKYGKKYKRNLSPEQRKKIGERLNSNRNSKKS